MKKTLKMQFVRKIDLARPIASALERSGWTVTHQNDWCLLWTGRMRDAEVYRQLRPGQIIRHLYGGWILDNKSHLSQTLDRAAARMAERGLAGRFDFHPMTFRLPEQFAEYEKEATHRPDVRWILKPADNGEGHGILLLDGPTDASGQFNSIVQEYIKQPHLLDGFKYTLRIFLLVTSLDPLTVYVYPDGLMKRAARPYSADKSVTDTLVHLTNSGIVRSDPEGDGTFRNLSLLAYRRRLRESGVDDEALWAAIRRFLIVTVIAARDPILAAQRADEIPRHDAFELLGLDVTLDESLKPWLLECNTNPGLDVEGKASSGYAQAERSVKEEMLGDLGGMLRATALWEQEQPPVDDFSLPEHVLARATIENAARGRFERVFPAADVSEHFGCFPFPRYLDIVLARQEDPGFIPGTPILRLRSVREELDGDGLILAVTDSEKFHRLNPTAAYVWAANADGLTVDNMVAELCEQFPDSGVHYEHDVRKALADFLEDGLLKETTMLSEEKD